MQPVINDAPAAPGDEVVRRCAGPDDRTEEQQDAQVALEDPAPEEAGYGYGV